MGFFSRLTRSPHIHHDVGERFRRHLRTGLILDLPAGDGVNCRNLLSAGFSVRGADLFPERYHVEGATCDSVDITQPLPYEDGSFDGVLHSEGIEHISDQVSVLHELARVLKPGGALIVTTPNLLHLEGRLAFLLTGHRHPRRALVAESSAYRGGPPSTEDERTYFGHVFLINYFQLRFYLTHVGLEVVDVDTTRYSWKSVLLAPLLWLPVYLSTRRLVRRETRRGFPELRRALLREVLSPPVLFGRKLIMVARKPG
jgi:SAM-dependent methyltransferase